MADMNLVELFQTLQEQQQEYAETTEALSRAIEQEQLHHLEASEAISETLNRISGLLSALLGGSASSSPTVVVVEESEEPEESEGAVAVKRPGKSPRAAKPSRRGGRGKAKTTGNESVLEFVRQHKNPTSAELSAHWKSEGRGGKVDNILGILVKAGKLTRTPIEGARGSYYSIA